MSHDLNPSQREAVKTLSGPLLVLAGAGSGKTRVVTFRIAELIRHGIRPSRILAVTFTNKAAGEMQERASKLLGKRLPEKPEISTFHSLCVRILRRHIQHLGYPPQFAIYDRGDQEGLARQALRDIRVPEATLRPGDLLAFIGRWKTASIRPEEAATLAQSDKEHLASAGYRRYQRSLKIAGAVDFDDLLLCTEELLQKFPAVRQAESSRFDHVLVDEYQDTNGSQYRIIKALAEGHRNLCVVGDDDQSIYGWRGAEVAHILQFDRDWPRAKIVRLEENYRSTAAILNFANTLIAYNNVRHDKILRASRQGGEPPRILQLPDETVEAKQVVDEINAQVLAHTAEPRDFAILFRTNEQPRVFETELRKAKLPYVLVGGMSFFDRKEVRDILAYLKLLANPRDEVSLLRIINVPARGIGAKAVETLLAQAVTQGKPLWEILSAAELQGDFPKGAVESFHKFRGLVEEFRTRVETGTESLVDIARDLIRTVNYRVEIERLYKEPNDQETRWKAVEEVVNALGSYVAQSRKPTLTGFLDDTALAGRDDKPDAESQQQRNAILLMTLHSAKGLEFPQVYLVGMEEGLLPHHRAVEAGGSAIDEERRLCYVGVTRAQDRLTLTLALGRQKWGKSRPTVASRFLFELIGKADRATDGQTPRPARRLPQKSTAKRPQSKKVRPNSQKPSRPGTSKPG